MNQGITSDDSNANVCEANEINLTGTDREQCFLSSISENEDEQSEVASSPLNTDKDKVKHL